MLSGVGPGLGSLARRGGGQAGRRPGARRRAPQKRLDKMAEVVRSHGRRALVVPTDINDEEALPAPGRRARSTEFGRVDCLINNAFAIPPMDPLTTLEHDALRSSLETNAFAPLRLSTLFADALARRSQGLDHHGQLARCCGSRSRSSPATS